MCFFAERLLTSEEVHQFHVSGKVNITKGTEKNEKKKNRQRNIWIERKQQQQQQDGGTKQNK